MLKLSASFFIFLLPFLACISAADTKYLQVLIRDIDNPAGTLADGSSCGNFGFLAVGCQNTWLRTQVTAGSNFSGSVTDRQISSNGQNRISNINLLIEDASAGTYDAFTGFKVSIQLSPSQDFNVSIDFYEFSVETTASQGVYTYTHIREGTLSTTVSIAWSTNISPPTETTIGETTIRYTGTTETPLPTTTAAKLPVDCDEVVDKTSGNQTIYPDGVTGVQVYCDQKSYGAYTTIQSRSSNDTVDFNVTLEAYYKNFGSAGPDTNFWLGLENMNLVTSKKTYSLQIDLCCGTKLVSKQIYHSFKIGDNSTGFKLLANPDIPGIGLDYSSTVKDIGAPFSVPSGYILPSAKPSCDELEFADDKDNEVKKYGGWWYGSCANNLNGAYISSSDKNGTCYNNKFATNNLLGVNLRIGGSPMDNGWDVDEVSYDRVRMVLFTFDSLNVERNDDTFCK